jgi:hypothetical protein
MRGRRAASPSSAPRRAASDPDASRLPTRCRDRALPQDTVAADGDHPGDSMLGECTAMMIKPLGRSRPGPLFAVRLILAPVDAENRKSNDGHRVLLVRARMQDRADDNGHLSVGGRRHLDLRGGRHHLGVQHQHRRNYPDDSRGPWPGAVAAVWSSFAPYRRGRTVAGEDTVVEERRIERDLP